MTPQVPSSSIVGGSAVAPQRINCMWCCNYRKASFPSFFIGHQRHVEHPAHHIKASHPSHVEHPTHHIKASTHQMLSITPFTCWASHPSHVEHPTHHIKASTHQMLSIAPITCWASYAPHKSIHPSHVKHCITRWNRTHHILSIASTTC